MIINLHGWPLYEDPTPLLNAMFKEFVDSGLVVVWVGIYIAIVISMIDHILYLNGITYSISISNYRDDENNFTSS